MITSSLVPRTTHGSQLYSPYSTVIYCHLHISVVSPRYNNTYIEIMAIEIPGGKRNLNMNINAQQAILNAYITNN